MLELSTEDLYWFVAKYMPKGTINADTPISICVTIQLNHTIPPDQKISILSLLIAKASSPNFQCTFRAIEITARDKDKTQRRKRLDKKISGRSKCPDTTRELAMEI